MSECNGWNAHVAAPFIATAESIGIVIPSDTFIDTRWFPEDLRNNIGHLLDGMFAKLHYLRDTGRTDENIKVLTIARIYRVKRHVTPSSFPGPLRHAATEYRKKNYMSSY